ncbi:DUF4129 domain-containing protein [Actinomadura sp. CNU-125]|uniref:DUF4129 domain-containing protein n=1 Tax=Actinomadura sp. CNU-125 TaxID=1904961 RepID=UPI00096A7376
MGRGDPRADPRGGARPGGTRRPRAAAGPHRRRAGGRGGRGGAVLADALRAAVRTFDDVWYGDRPGTADGYAQVKDLDDRLRAARPAPLESDGPVPAGQADEDGGPRW